MLKRALFRPPAHDWWRCHWLGQCSLRSCRCVLMLVVAAVSGGVVRGEIITIETVHVGNPGNPADPATGGLRGSVGYTYDIGKYEVTAGQYCAFLNAVAATDKYGLYNTDMLDTQGCKIERTGSSGSYHYSIASDRANRPVNEVSWASAARFANWLHNGQPRGEQNASTTEDGAYDLSPTHAYYGPDGEIPAFLSADYVALNDALAAVTRKSGWTWAVPSEDEWYKAAYHKNDGSTSHYFLYPTGTDATPGNDLLDPDPGNNANFILGYYDEGDYWSLGYPYYTSVVGEFENSGSPYGTFDQGGNVMEWTEAAAHDSMFFGPGRVMRGGSYGSGSVGFWAESDYHVYMDGSVELKSSWRHAYCAVLIGGGFRVVNVPEPATAMLAIAGAVCAMLWRRRRSV